MAKLVGLILVAVLSSGCIELFQQEVADEQGESSPRLGFADDESGDRIAVVQAESNVRWSDLNVTGDRPAHVRLNDGPIRPFSPTHHAIPGTSMVQAGDKLDFCLQEPGPLEVRLLHTPTNSILHTFQFASVTTHEWCD